jgi:hypothetical protein
LNEPQSSEDSQSFHGLWGYLNIETGDVIHVGLGYWCLKMFPISVRWFYILFCVQTLAMGTAK